MIINSTWPLNLFFMLGISSEMSEESEDNKRPQFGNRFLKEDSNVFKHNVWDDVQWDADQEEEARKKVEKQSEQKIPEAKKQMLQEETEMCWDKFYGYHQNRFFKNRHWLFTEFPELTGNQRKPETPVRVFPPEDDNVSSLSKPQLAVSEDGNVETGAEDRQRKTYFEIGCGVGNTVFPILEYDNDHRLFVYCCDFSKKAIDILKSSKEYDEKRCHAFVCDVTADDWMTPFPAASLDISTLIFVLSAIHPSKMQHVVNQVYHYLKPGGLVLFRDYGRYDMAQLRFKEGQVMEDNFYVRKDGTFVYFFTQDEVTQMFGRAGFTQEHIFTDRRLQVNRCRQLKMYRVWVQGKFRKPFSS